MSEKELDSSVNNYVETKILKIYKTTRVGYGNWTSRS